MAIKQTKRMWKSILLLSTLLISFDATTGCENDEYLPGKPKVNCVDMAKELGVHWQTFSLPHVSDCTKFYGCSGSGDLVQMICADTENTRYDPFTRRCEWNSDIECITYTSFMNLQKTHKCE